MAGVTERQTRQASRLVGVDAARGLALLGMMAIHILPGWTEDFQPTATWEIFAGSSAALFAFLAGVSLSFSSGRSRPATGRTLTAARVGLAVRALIIATLGLLLGQLDPPAAVILTYYGMLFLMAIPLLGLGPKTLGCLAAGFAIIGPYLMQQFSRRLPDLEGYDPSVTALFTEPGAVLSAIMFTGSFPAVPWMAYICAGLAVGRLDLRALDTQIRMMIAGAVVAVAAWLLSLLLLGPLGGLERLIELSPNMGEEGVHDMLTWGPSFGLPTSTGWWLTIMAPYSNTPLEILNTLGTAAVALGAALMLGRKAPLALAPLSIIGGMTLTLYSAHVAFLATGWLSDTPYLSLPVQVAAAILFTVLWRNITGSPRGPLERLVASASTAARNRVLRPVAESSQLTREAGPES
ncbi:MAG TPA: heparan-alpha-glucosaminide N-acetyltransferase domain-containing protein [Arthrobacter sp.]|nr:heparan-alpha-glucosaminide N-acetyltransferase domain-containing protein [Arthrobacter sp.]